MFAVFLCVLLFLFVSFRFESDFLFYWHVRLELATFFLCNFHLVTSIHWIHLIRTFFFQILPTKLSSFHRNFYLFTDLDEFSPNFSIFTDIFRVFTSFILFWLNFVFFGSIQLFFPSIHLFLAFTCTSLPQFRFLSLWSSSKLAQIAWITKNCFVNVKTRQRTHTPVTNITNFAKRQ